MYICKCHNVEATLVVVVDNSLVAPLYLKRTGEPTDSFVGDSGQPSKKERQRAARSGPADDVTCPHCRTACTWAVCSSCGTGGEALRNVEPTGRVQCENCKAEQTVDDLHITRADDSYYVPDG